MGVTPRSPRCWSGTPRPDVDASLARLHARRGVWSVLVQTFNRFSDDRIMTEAAGVTFYVLLALFPAIATLISIYGLSPDPAVVSEQLQGIAAVVPSAGMGLIEDQVKALAANGRQTLSFGVVAGVLTSLVERQPGHQERLRCAERRLPREGEAWVSRADPLVAVLHLRGDPIFGAGDVGIVVLPIVMNFVGFANDTAVLLTLARWPLLIVVLTLFLSVVYRFGPSRTEPHWHWVTWGSACSVVGWVAASLAFSYYVANFGSYNKTYGSLGAVIGFITWIWISAMIVLLGAGTRRGAGGAQRLAPLRCPLHNDTD